MTKSDIVKQVKSNGIPKKVEVFVGAQYAPGFEIRTEHANSVALAFQRAVEGK